MDSGQSFEDIRQFKELLLADKEQIARCLTEKLLTYSLGRGLSFSDRPEVNEIVANTRERKYGFRSLIHAVVESKTFRQNWMSSYRSSEGNTTCLLFIAELFFEPLVFHCRCHCSTL